MKIASIYGPYKVRGDIIRGTRQKELHDYGIKDSKGRAVGGMLITWVENYVSDESSGLLIDASLIGKTRYCVELHSTRDGKVFGAIPRATYHLTADAANKHAWKAIDTARARAQRVHS